MRNSVAKYALGLVLLAAVYFGGRYHAPVVTPDSVQDAVTPGAAAYRKAYFAKLADDADAIAKQADDFEDWQPAFDAWKVRNEATREESQKLCTDPLDAFCKAGMKEYGPYDPKRFREGLRRVSDGFRGAK